MKHFVMVSFDHFRHTRERGEGRRGKCVFRPTSRRDGSGSTVDIVDSLMDSGDEEVIQADENESSEDDDGGERTVLSRTSFFAPRGLHLRSTM